MLWTAWKLSTSFLKASFNSPEVPGRPASSHIDVRELRVHWPDRHPEPLLIFIPDDLEADFHVDLSLVGHILATTARDLHAAEEAKVDALPDPGPGMDCDIKLCGDHNSIVFKKTNFQALLSKFKVMPFTFKKKYIFRQNQTCILHGQAQEFGIWTLVYRFGLLGLSCF